MLYVNDIFLSIDGEVNYWGQGGFSIFIRLGGCNLSCRYCDTSQAQDTGTSKLIKIIEMVNYIKRYPCNKVTITGGEPLSQSKTFELIKTLEKHGYNISVETNGTYAPRACVGYTTKISFVVDYKLEYADQMLFRAENLTKMDFIKIPIISWQQYAQAKAYILKTRTLARIYMSPVFGEVDVNQLIHQLEQDDLLHVGVNLQLHKYANVK